MSARSSFFPKAPSAEENRIESTNISVNNENPLHAGRTHNTHAQRKEMSTTSGLAGVMQKNKQGAAAAAIPRPGTAAPGPVPRVAEPHTHVASPVPQRPLGNRTFLMPPPTDSSSTNQLLFTPRMRADNTSGMMPDFRVDYDYHKHASNAHIVSSDHNNQHIMSNSKTTTGSAPFLGSPNGPQRVLNVPRESLDVQPFQDQEGHSLDVNRFVPNPRKRRHVDADKDDASHDIHQRPNANRYKAAHSREKTADHRFSPSLLVELSSPLSRRTQSSGDDEYGSGPHHYTGEEDTSPLYGGRLSQNPFTDTLSEFPNFDMDKVMAMYKEIEATEGPKWENCTDEEWIAGGKALMQKHNKIVEEMMEVKIGLLKAYRAIHATGDRHTRENDRRKETLVAIRRRITEASSNVLSG